MKKVKHILGLLLFWLSWLLWALMFIVPLLLDSGVESMAVIVTSLLVAAEVCFAVSLLLLGRPFYHATKARLKSIWGKVFSRKRSLENVSEEP